MDHLVELSKNPTARKVWKSLGIPLRLPQPLRRAKGPWKERPLEGRTAVIATAPGPVSEVLAHAVVGGGADAHLAPGWGGTGPPAAPPRRWCWWAHATLRHLSTWRRVRTPAP